MGYANPSVTQTITFDSVNFATGSTSAVKGPSGLVGYVREISVIPTVTFTATTTAARVRVGTSGANADVNLGTTAAGTAFAASKDSPGSIKAVALAADSQIPIAFVAPTGGTPAGTAKVSITIEWF